MPNPELSRGIGDEETVARDSFGVSAHLETSEGTLLRLEIIVRQRNRR